MTILKSTLFRKSALWAVTAIGAVSMTISPSEAQTRKNVFQAGEKLTYNVKYGPIKLGTVVIQTGGVGADGNATARMQFWTADVPFLDTKTTINDVIDTKNVSIVRFEEHTVNGDKKIDKHFEYNRGAKTLTYTGDGKTGDVTKNVEPFNDALALVFNMRTWSASGKKYSFLMRGKDGQKPVVINFTNKISNEEVPALDDKEIRTRVLEGVANMGSSSPLGADGGFTAYVSDDEAAIPVRIDMKIAVGSISLVLDQVKRQNWTASK
jgi:hypothetical protein